MQEVPKMIAKTPSDKDLGISTFLHKQKHTHIVYIRDSTKKYPNNII